MFCGKLLQRYSCSRTPEQFEEKVGRKSTAVGQILETMVHLNTTWALLASLMLLTPAFLSAYVLIPAGNSPMPWQRRTPARCCTPLRLAGPHVVSFRKASALRAEEGNDDTLDLSKMYVPYSNVSGQLFMLRVLQVANGLPLVLF